MELPTLEEVFAHLPPTPEEAAAYAAARQALGDDVVLMKIDDDTWVEQGDVRYDLGLLCKCAEATMGLWTLLSPSVERTRTEDALLHMASAATLSGTWALTLDRGGSVRWEVG